MTPPASLWVRRLSFSNRTKSYQDVILQYPSKILTMQVYLTGSWPTTPLSGSLPKTYSASGSGFRGKDKGAGKNLTATSKSKKLQSRKIMAV